MKRLYDVIVKRVFLILIVSIISISTISLCTIYAYILPNVRHLVNNHVLTQVSDINLWFQFNSELIRLYATQFQKEEISVQNQKKLLAKLNEFKEKSNIQYDSLGFITLDGQKYVTDNAHFQVLDRSYFKELKDSNKDVVISDVIESKSNKNKIILILAKIYDQQKKVKGFISGALKTTYIENLMTNVAGNFRAYLKNDKNKIVLGKEYFTPGSMHVEKPLHAYLKLTYVLDIPQSYYMKKILVTIILIILATIILLFIAQYVIKHVVNRIVKPLQGLVNAMLQAKKGVLEKNNANIEILEFHNLNNDYNQMIEEIHLLLTKVKEKEIERNNANNKAMYAQIKPHFLYNTLETIQAIAFENDDHEVEKAIHDLAVFFRIGLSNDRQIISLEEEIKHVKSYLNIQKLRYRNILEYHFKIENINLKSPFLKFTLQPLVENAIYHGVKLLTRKAAIMIHIYQKESNIVIDVENDFEKIDLKLIHEINHLLKQGSIPNNQLGYGLFNVNARIKHQYGDCFGVYLIVQKQRFISRMVQPGKE